MDSRSCIIRRLLAAQRPPCTASNCLARSELLAPVNPQNINVLVGRPDAMSAVRTAEGPGMGMMGSPASAAAATRSAPGSLIAGVPASDTTAMAAPRSSCWMICITRVRRGQGGGDVGCIVSQVTVDVAQGGP